MQIRAQHRTQKKPNGEPLQMLFTEEQWLQNWQPTGQWLLVETITNIAHSSHQTRIVEPQKPKKLTISVKNKCCT